MINFLYETIKFIVVAVVFKLIILHWFAERITKWFASRNTRNMTIWQHFVKRSYGKGHDHKSVLECYEESCAKL